jgi:hypothetical protein
MADALATWYSGAAAILRMSGSTVASVPRQRTSSAACPRHLVERLVGHERRRGAHVPIPAARHHPDDFDVVAPRPPPSEALADRGLAGARLVRQRLIRDAHWWAAGPVGGGDVTALRIDTPTVSKDSGPAKTWYAISGWPVASGDRKVLPIMPPGFRPRTGDREPAEALGAADALPARPRRATGQQSANGP